MKKIITITLLLFIFSTIYDVVFLSNNFNSFGLLSQTFAAKETHFNFGNVTINETRNFDFIDIRDNKLEFISEEILYKNVKGTVYHAVAEQTDSTPLITADMSVIDTNKVNELRWVALSRDLLDRTYKGKDGVKYVWKGRIKLGDTIWVDYNRDQLWKISKYNQTKFEQLIEKHEKVKGFWIVHDVMGTEYTKRNKNGEYIYDENGEKQKVKIYNSIDFLQHPKTGVLDMWDRTIIISKRNVKSIPLDISILYATR